MVDAQITEGARPGIALHGRVVKREQWRALVDVDGLLAEATRIRDQANTDIEAATRAAHADGFDKGHGEGLAKVAAELVRVQAEAREFLAREQPRIAELACAIVARIAPRLDAAALVAALVAEALAQMQAEPFVQVRVHPDVVARVEAELERWRDDVPGAPQIAVTADSELDLLGCVVVAESGKIEAGLDEQLEALRAALQAAAEATGERA